MDRAGPDAGLCALVATLTRDLRRLTEDGSSNLLEESLPLGNTGVSSAPPAVLPSHPGAARSCGIPCRTSTP